ncbi:MAG: hypothetical protein K2X81_01955, partial [Candidatus Obscuribacterales bacterium]|nr:hypothetical protein [Candidatus Obscuribacterales bacterium]
MTTRFSTLLIIALSTFLAHPKAIAQPETASSRPIPGHVSTSATQGKIDAGVSVGTIQANVQNKGQKNYAAPAGFLVTTTSSIDGYTILDYKGLVEGAAVRVPTWNEDASAGQQEVYGG